MRMMSPCVRRRGCSRRAPFRYVPFVEPRSCTQTPSWRGSKRAWRADANSSERIGMSFCSPRPIVSCAESSSKSWPSSRSGLLTTTSRTVTGSRRAGWTELGLDAELLHRDGLRRLGHSLRLVDHRGAGLDVGRRLALGRRAALRMHHARRDAELADVQVVVRLHQDAHRRQERIALAPRMLGEVLLQLAAQVLLVALELLAVAGREVDGVLVGDVDPGDRDRAMVLHLLCQLPRQLDRLDVRSERTAEDALEEGLDLSLDCAQNHVPEIP